MQVFRGFIGIFLAVVLAVTGLSAAHARGQTGPAGSIVICKGLTVATILVDAEGQPVEQPHICPDAALALFVETGETDLPAAIAVTWRAVDWPQARPVQARAAVTHTWARGPPASL
ncbi:hypothetical protein KUW09_06995 [Mameliella alba]|nr:hypothetical protein [Antarctobacter heliothermus]MBY6143784.1 hypothetical protein [Mameliella alba]MCA0952492.1 hypothetical protein [Mameliella alba]